MATLTWTQEGTGFVSTQYIDGNPFKIEKTPSKHSRLTIGGKVLVSRGALQKCKEVAEEYYAQQQDPRDGSGVEGPQDNREEGEQGSDPFPKVDTSKTASPTPPDSSTSPAESSQNTLVVMSDVGIETPLAELEVRAKELEVLRDLPIMVVGDTFDQEIPAPVAERKTKKREGSSNRIKAEPPPPIDPQKAINEMVYNHGKNCTNHADYPLYLARYGIDGKDVTDERIDIAHETARQRLHNGPEALQWEGPVQKDFGNGTSTIHEWETACGRLKIGRVDGAEPRFAVIVKTHKESAKEAILKNDIRTLDAALDAAEQWYGERQRLSTVKSNRKNILREAEAKGLHKRTETAPALVETNGKATKKTATITSEEEKAAKDLDRSLAAERKTRATSSAGVDRFGTPLNSEAAKINAILSSTPKSVKELVEEAKCEVKLYQGKEPQLGVYYTHLKKLLAGGFVTKEGKRYVLK